MEEGGPAVSDVVLVIDSPDCKEKRPPSTNPSEYCGFCCALADKEYLLTCTLCLNRSFIPCRSLTVFNCVIS